MAMPDGGRHVVPESDLSGLPVDLDEAIAELDELDDLDDLPAEGTR